MQRFLFAAAVAALLIPRAATAQEDEVDAGQITGNVQLLFQTYQEDSLIGAQVPPGKTGFNAFGNLIYTRATSPPACGTRATSTPFSATPDASAVPVSGLSLRDLRQGELRGHPRQLLRAIRPPASCSRAYEERQLGIDNALDGFRLILRPADGVTLKGLVGKQRLDFDSGLINGPGTIRAMDGEINLNDAFERLATSGTRVTLGASFVSRFQPGSTSPRTPSSSSCPTTSGRGATAPKSRRALPTHGRVRPEDQRPQRRQRLHLRRRRGHPRERRVVHERSGHQRRLQGGRQHAVPLRPEPPASSTCR